MAHPLELIHPRNLKYLTRPSYAVFGLLARVMINAGVGVLTGLGAYIGVVLLGMLVLLVVFVTIAVVLGRQRPWRFLADIRDAQLLAFSNVTADLMAATVMDRFLPATRTRAEELRAEARLEAERARTGEDVIAPAGGG